MFPLGLREDKAGSFCFEQTPSGRQECEHKLLALLALP